MAIKNVHLIKEWFLDLLFPKFCLGCNQEGSSFCTACQEKIDIVWPKGERQVEGIGRIIGMGLYRDKLWQNLIQDFKYGYLEELEQAIESIFQRFIKKYPDALTDSYDLVVPIPLYKRRFLERSFNQAEVFAKIISQHTGWPMSTSLIRTKNTLPQAQLSDDERVANVKDAFQVKEPNNFKNKKILLVDDVLTTGSTLKQAAKALRAAGAREVGVWVMARRS